MVFEYIIYGYVVLCSLGWVYVLFYKKYQKTDLYYIREAKRTDRETIEILLHIGYEKFDRIIDNWCIVYHMHLENNELVKN